MVGINATLKRYGETKAKQRLPPKSVKMKMDLFIILSWLEGQQASINIGFVNTVAG